MAKNAKYWPSAGDYLEAVQNPAVAFADPRLRASRAQANRLGLPRTRSGAFANVYKLEHAGGALAVRVFLYDAGDERKRRYGLVTHHLRRSRPGSMVDFAYDPEGILVRRERFPILTMEWVDGKILGNWVEEKVLGGDARALRQMADRWSELVRQLARHQIAHGDLQHANVMVVGDGRPVLVDYDCMAVPGLFDQPPLERGLPAYQHPRRTNPKRFAPGAGPVKLSPTLDAFSALVIQTALRALAADLGLYRRFVVDTRNENLLFDEKDHADPAASELYKALEKSPDPDVAEWSRMLRAWAAGPLEMNPGGPDVIPDPDPHRDLRGQVARKDWEKVAAHAPKPGRPLPADLAAAVIRSKERMRAKAGLEAALASNDPRRAASARAAAGAALDDWPAVRGLLDRVRQAEEGVKALDRLKAAAGTPRLVQVWKADGARTPRCAEAGLYEAEARLREAVASKDWGRIVPLVHPHGASSPPADLKAVVAEAQRKGRLREALERAARSRDERQVAATLADVGAALDDWPACAGLLADARKSASAVTALDRLKAAAGTPEIEKAWDQLGPNLPSGPEADRYRAEVSLRRAARLKDWDALATLVGRPGGAATSSPAGVPADLAPILAEARRKAALRDRLEESVGSGDPRRIDQALAAAGPTLDDWPTCRMLLDRARRGAEAARWLDRLEAAKDSPELPGVWDQLGPKLVGVAGAEAYRREAERWRERNARLSALTGAVAAGSGERAIRDAWEALEAAGGHPDAKSHEPRARLAARRVECLEAVGRALAGPPSEASDRRAEAAWDEALLGRCAGADEARRGVERARGRLEAVRRVEAVLARPGEGPEKERAVAEAARALPPGYDFRQGPRVEAARRRHAALEELARALAGQSDVRIAGAWDAARKEGAPVAPAQEGRCQLAARRRDALERLEAAAPASLPADERDRAWLRNWDDPLLRPCPDAAAALKRYEEARRRADDVVALRLALDEPNPTRVGELADRLGDYPPLRALRGRIDATLVDHRRIREVRRALEAFDRPGASPAEKDGADAAIRRALAAPGSGRAGTELLARYPAEFRPGQAALDRWLRERVLHRPPAAADPPFLRDAGGPRSYRVRWLWPDELVDFHWVATDPAAPPRQPGGARMSRAALAQGGGHAVRLEGPRLFVAIWPAVGLGWAEFVGPRLDLAISADGRGPTLGPAPPPAPPATRGSWGAGRAAAGVAG